MKIFTKEDLKPGMLVKTRDCGYMHVFDTAKGLCVSNKNDYCGIRLYDDELKCKGFMVPEPEFDIMEVWDLASSAMNSYKLSVDGRGLLWEREEESEEESNDEKTVDMYVNGKKIGELDWNAGFTFTDLYGIKTIVDPDSDDDEDDEVEEDDFDDEIFDDDDDLEDFMKDNLGGALLLGLAAGIAKVIEDSVKNDDKEGK